MKVNCKNLDEDGETDEAEDDCEDGVDEAAARKSEVEVAADAEAGVLLRISVSS